MSLLFRFARPLVRPARLPQHSMSVLSSVSFSSSSSSIGVSEADILAQLEAMSKNSRTRSTKHSMNNSSNNNSGNIHNKETGSVERSVPPSKTAVRSGFSGLGLAPAVEAALLSMGLQHPTPAQAALLPRLVRCGPAIENRIQNINNNTNNSNSVVAGPGGFENVIMASRTGSGKTLAFLLPIFHKLHIQERDLQFDRSLHSRQSPRALVLAPTRELAEQILAVAKSLGHSCRAASALACGGEPLGRQRKAFDGRLVDIVVGSPGRVLQLVEAGSLSLGQVHTVVVDEIDTMLTQGFGDELRELLRQCRGRGKVAISGNLVDKDSRNLSDLAAGLGQVQVIGATATLTDAVRQLFADYQIMPDASVQGGALANGKLDPFRFASLATLNPVRRSLAQSQSPDQADGGKSSKISITSGGTGGTGLSMSVVSVDGLHQAVPNVRYEFDYLKDFRSKTSRINGDVAEGAKADADKVALLVNRLRQFNSKGQKTLVFCNTVKSCRSVSLTLKSMSPSELGLPVENSEGMLLEYHGDISPEERFEQMQLFKEAGVHVDSRGKPKDKACVLVATDLAARGLDIPEIDNVILFDFPLNTTDFLHRSGRCGRSRPQADGTPTNRPGRVVSLVTKRDEVLAQALERAIQKGQPLEGLSAAKKDYQDHGRFAPLMDRPSREESYQRELEDRRLLAKITNKCIITRNANSRSRKSGEIMGKQQLAESRERQQVKDRQGRRMEAQDREKREEGGRRRVREQELRSTLRAARSRGR